MRRYIRLWGSLDLLSAAKIAKKVLHSRVFWLFWLKSASLSRVLGVFGIFDNVLRFGDNVLRSGDNVLKSADNVLTMCLSGKASRPTDRNLKIPYLSLN